MSDDQKRMQKALDEIAGPGLPVECWIRPVEDAPGAWAWRWECAYAEAGDAYVTPDEAIAAACRTLRAALGVPEPREVKLREALLCMLMSADAAWEENRGGHDWPEACELAREALRRGGYSIDRHRGGDGSTTPPGAPYGTGAVRCGRALCTAIEDRCGLLVGHPGPCEARR